MIELFEYSALGYVVGYRAFMIINRLSQRYIVLRCMLHAERSLTHFGNVIDV